MPGPNLPSTHPAHEIAKKRQMRHLLLMKGKRAGAQRMAKAEQLQTASRRLLEQGSGSIGDVAKRKSFPRSAWSGADVGTDPAVK